MRKTHLRFADFAVGDHVFFTRRFTHADFEVFAQLSGDRNPLHGDAEYGARSEYGRTIVSLLLATSPLSGISGMMLPGEPSLCLSHDLRAHHPIFYDETLTYSARIIAVNQSHTALTLRVLILRDMQVAIEDKMVVYVRVPEWTTPSSLTIHRAGEPRLALVTGANGAIGAAIARTLAKRGWNLLLHARRGDTLDDLAGACAGFGVAVDVLAADLEDPAARQSMISQMVDLQPFPLAIIHTASPPLDASLDRLVSVNYSALKELVDVALPNLLQRQEGVVLTIGSTALDHFPSGWENYVAAKAMAVSFLAGVDKRYGQYGVRGITVAPGYVHTRFSQGWRETGAAVLLPEEVADVVADCLDNRGDQRPYIVLGPSVRRQGQFGFHANDQTQAPIVDIADKGDRYPQRAQRTRVHAPTSAAQGDLAGVVQHSLDLPSDTDMSNAELGVTPGWDSLRHIELVLELERTFDIAFSSQEIDRTKRFDTLEQLWRGKLEEKVNGVR